MLLATTIDGYILRVVVAAHDEKTVKQLEVVVSSTWCFFRPPNCISICEADAQAYDGPAISSHRLASLQADPPVSHIDPGKIGGDFYENATLGFSYRIPQGWTLEARRGVQPAVETRSRHGKILADRHWAQPSAELLEACSRTLFSAWAKAPGADGQISYDDFGEVTVTAISAACFPGMKFPQDVNDRQGSRIFSCSYG